MNEIKIITSVYSSPVGELLLGEYDSRICMCDWVDSLHSASVINRLLKLLSSTLQPETTRLLTEAQTQLDEYFAGTRKVFNLPIVMAGTDFQKRVWESVMEVGYGDTLSYGELAKEMGNPKGVRAVAAAVGANATSIIVPCHRVVGSDGSLTGYAGGLQAKQYLLELEKNSK